MQRNGAAIVEIDASELDADKLVASNDVQKYEFKNLINIYLAGVPNTQVKSLAEIIASTLLAGELSIGAAIITGEFVGAHEMFGRNRPDEIVNF